MRYRKTEIWKSVDWITILLYLIMVIAGWFSICGASYEFDNRSEERRVGKECRL